MAQPYIGQIELFSFGYAPRGWAVCAGQIMAIAQNQALFSLLGTTYGGNGSTTFGLPDLRGAAAMGQGSGQGLTPRGIGQFVGSETQALNSTQIPPHTHNLNARQSSDTSTNVYTPDNTQLLAETIGYDAQGGTIPFPIYASDSAPNQVMAATAIGVTGGQPHSNMMPYLVGNFCIALVGAYPSRN